MALPMDAAMIKTMALSCCVLNCSDSTSHPAKAPTAGSKLSKMLKVCLGKCLSEYISKL